MTDTLLKTPVAAVHDALGARMVPFSGWLMPLQYEGLVAEHLHTRKSAGLFDLSHMGRLSITGPGALDLIQHATTNDAGRLAVGAAQYSLICNERGTVIEDLLVYRLPDRWLLVVNASNRTRVVAHLDNLSEGLGCDAALQDETFDVALLGLQGPDSQAVLQPMVEGDLSALGYYHARVDRFGAEEIIVSRSGYTGEDGFELIVPSSRAAEIWQRLLADVRVRPIGLGARDTLRLEAGMALYGHELTEEITPYEACLGRVVRLDKGDFVGRDALAELHARGPDRKLVGLASEAGAVPRAGFPVVVGEPSTHRRFTDEPTEIGAIASGTFSPTLRHPIATAFVRSDLTTPGTAVGVRIREARVAARVVSLPFVPHHTKR